MANQNTGSETNLFEELTDADLMAVVGGTGGTGLADVDLDVKVSKDGLEVTRTNEVLGLGTSISSVKVDSNGVTVTNNGAQTGNEQIKVGI